MKCKNCHREAQEDGYCNLHIRAFQNLEEKFKVWHKASGNTWIDYLEQIQKNSLTGEWAKEVAKYLIEEDQKCQVK